MTDPAIHDAASRQARGPADAIANAADSVVPVQALDDAVMALQGILEHPGDQEVWQDAKSALPRLMKYLEEPASPQTADAKAEPMREAIMRAICCPKGCVRTDDCLAGDRREHREITDAILALTSPAVDRAAAIEAAARQVVKDYPVAAGTLRAYQPEDGYGSIRALRIALAGANGDGK
jgi:hypothetical protein